MMRGDKRVRFLLQDVSTGEPPPFSFVYLKKMVLFGEKMTSSITCHFFKKELFIHVVVVWGEGVSTGVRTHTHKVFISFLAYSSLLHQFFFSFSVDKKNIKKKKERK